MQDDHHIEVTDEVTFFKLHDLDNDGFWSDKELQSLYGFERDIDPNESHIKTIIDRVYQDMDLNKDGFISLEEYITNQLPSLSKNDEKIEVDMKEETKNKKKKSKEESDNNQQPKVIVNNKRTPSPKKKKPIVTEKVFNQQGNDYIPNKFRV
jgi:hypothetical protein